MTHLTAIRDKAGALIGFTEHATAEPQFAQMLASTMAAVGATSDDRAPTTDEPPTTEAARSTWRPGRPELAAIAAGLVLAVALIVALNAFWPAPVQGTRYPAQPTAAPIATAAPTSVPTVVSIEAHAEPNGALLGTIPLTATIGYRHSRWPGWAGVEWRGAIVWVQTARPLDDLPDLAPPTPAPAPTPRAPVVAPVVPADTACDPQVNPRYTSPLRVDPIGSVTGASCTSQGEADANAVQLAEAMRATADAPSR